MSQIIKIHPLDNVAVALKNLNKGEFVVVEDKKICLKEDILQGHKFAITEIPEGESVIKYGYPIGHSINSVETGEFVHTHNLRTNLKGVLEYKYKKSTPLSGESLNKFTFKGYKRANGTVGVRNEIWIINTVGCVNKSAEIIAKECSGVQTFTHPYGCSQLGDDHKATQSILKNLVLHPNAGGVLVLGLGCENNNIKEFKKVLGNIDQRRVRFLETQTVNDEIAEAKKIVSELKEIIKDDKREDCDLRDLVIGLKCGGSDGLSGITANPLLGEISNLVIDSGGATILTEVPEMFGAEEILMNRAKDEAVFKDTVNLINSFKEYFQRHNQVIYENPSPGNKDGGITTLEEKSLGCTQKGGNREVERVYDYGQKVVTKGLNLLNGPGNDIVAVTNLAAAGAQIILFTTGRGTPLGSPVPTIKVSSNSELANKKRNWIDFDAGALTRGKDMDSLSRDFINYILDVASGTETLNEINNYRDMAILKDGVTL